MSTADSLPNAEPDATGLRWRLTCAIGAVLAIGYLIAAGLLALILLTSSTPGFDPGTVLLAALPGWLAMHQVPLTIMGAPLSVLPLLPTAVPLLLIAVASARVARCARLRRPEQAKPVILAMGFTHAFAGLVIALCSERPVLAMPVNAFLTCGLTAVLAATAGVAGRCGLILLVWERVGAGIWSGVRIGLLALAGMAGAGALVLVAAIGASAPEMAAAMRGSAGDVVGMTVLSLLYLPNAVVGGWSFAAGTGFSVGTLRAGPLAVEPGQVPDLPLLAVLPVQGPALWWFLALLLPIGVGALTGLALRRVPGSRLRRLWVLVVAAGIAASGVLVVAWLAGGVLGNGPVGPVNFEPGMLAAMTLCWLLPPAAALVLRAEPSDAETIAGPEVPQRTVIGEAAPADPEFGDPEHPTAPHIDPAVLDGLIAQLQAVELDGPDATKRADDRTEP